MSPVAREHLPQDIAYRLFRGKAVKSSFIEKLYVLYRFLGKRFWVVIEDEENGLTIEDFLKLNNFKEDKNPMPEGAEVLVSNGVFVLGSKELSGSLSYLNDASSSSAYKYLKTLKNAPLNRVEKKITELEYIARFLAFYESNKKKWSVKNNTLNIQEWYVLIGIFSGGWMKSSLLYKEIFRQAFQSGAVKIKMACSSLSDKKYVERRGSNKFMEIRITPSGKEVVHSILNKYALSF